ncbi:MAG: patatin-like phospholipase family protein, partial [Verrucomicrobiota bacterium]
MPYEYIRVKFEEERAVLCGGNDIGKTNRKLRIDPGSHTISLDGAQDYTPPEQVVEVENTTRKKPKVIKFEKLVALLFAAIAFFQTPGCAHHPVNPPLRHWDATTGYRFKNLPPTATNTDELFVILAFSGGGTWAAALSYGALEGLGETKINFHGVEKNLLDEVDIVSTIFGGSFTGAYFALHGNPPWRDYEDHFLNRNVTLGLFLGLVNPLHWPKLASPHYDRIDMAADYYDRLLFHGQTFGDLEQKRSRPFLMVNATDMSLARRFEFSQDQFDLMSSDLSSVPVARAVTASSAFPFLLSPLTLNNYGTTQNGYALPAWVKDALANRQKYPRDYAEGLALQSYLDATNRPFVHLLDGGLSDNVGLRGPFYALTSSKRPWTLLSLLNGTIKHLVVVTVNARNGTRPEWDGKEKAPGVGGMFSTVVNGPMGNYSEETVQQMIDRASEINAENLEEAGSSSRARDTAELNKLNVYTIEVNFLDVKNKEKREELLRIGTSFNLSKKQVNLLRATAKELIADSDGLKKLRANLAKP